MSQSIIPEPRRFDLAQMSRSWPTFRRPAFLATLVGSVHRALLRRRDRLTLATLDDRALSDIGLGPGAIDHAVRYGRGEDGRPRR